MDIKKLADSFYDENSHLQEVLDKSLSDEWFPDKTRGYGIVVIEFKGLKFGIPLRSNMNHSSGFHTVGNKGLDFSKAVLIKDNKYISNESFIIPKEEHTKIRDKSYFISSRFNKYVSRYCDLVNNESYSVIDRVYNFSTLKNYHCDLDLCRLLGCCIPLPIEDEDSFID